MRRNLTAIKGAQLLLIAAGLACQSFGQGPPPNPATTVPSPATSAATPPPLPPSVINPDASSPDLKPNPQALLKQWEAAADGPYELGRGDEISVSVANRPELSSKMVVGPDGKITVPIAGSLVVAGLPREAAAAAIQSALSTYYDHVSVSVGVDKYNSNHIFLTGAVEHPGMMEFTENPTLLEAISRASLQSGSDKVGSAPDQCFIFRTGEQVVSVNLRDLLHTGQPNLKLIRGDTVYVPSPKDSYVSVMGYVTHPGIQELHTNSTVADLIAGAGDILDKAGRNPQINIFDPQHPDKPQFVAYKDALRMKALDLHLKTGDVIYVPESGFNRASYTIQQLSPLITMFTIAALFTQ